MKMLQFPKRLKTRLKELEISQMELSKRTGIDRTLINKYINGIAEPKQQNLDKIAKALNTTDTWLKGFDLYIPNWNTISIDYENMELIKENLPKDIYDYLKLDNEDYYDPSIPEETIVNNSFMLENTLKKIGLLKSGKKINNDELNSIINFIEKNKKLLKEEIDKENKEKQKKWQEFVNSPLYKEYVKEFGDN